MPLTEKLTRIYDRLFNHYGPQHWWPADTPFEVIVGAVLTQAASWTNVEKALANLKEDDALSSEAIRDMPVVRRLVRGVRGGMRGRVSGGVPGRVAAGWRRVWEAEGAHTAC